MHRLTWFVSWAQIDGLLGESSSMFIAPVAAQLQQILFHETLTPNSTHLAQTQFYPNWQIYLRSRQKAHLIWISCRMKTYWVDFSLGLYLGTVP